LGCKLVKKPKKIPVIMDKETKAIYTHNRDKGITSCPYCDEKKSVRLFPIFMGSDESYATRTVVCYTNEGGCGKGWTEYWDMTDVQKH